MRNHGISHGAAMIVCTITSSLLVDVFRKHLPFLHEMTNRVSNLLINAFDINVSMQHLTMMLWATTLSVLWGVAFAVVHED
jgi:hypothetical protein